MSEHERVIQHFSDCCDIAEANGNGWVFVRTDVLYEAIDLLKAQEPVEPTWKNGYPLCGECGFKLHWIIEQNNYCPNCGRAVKWDDF